VDGARRGAIHQTRRGGLTCAIDQVSDEESAVSVHVLYRTSSTATGGRDGRATTADGNFSVKLATPKALGGAGGPGNNPEELFASGYAACFLAAMHVVASRGGPKVPADANVTVDVGIGPRTEGGYGLDVVLDVALPGLELEEAETMVEEAHRQCPYSNAIRNNVPLRSNVV
jgi:Ohr subfamily peroxiredoxin